MVSTRPINSIYEERAEDSIIYLSTMEPAR